jgi:hypothetical protein
MAADDHAVVVGIERYESLDDLAGPENDAAAVIEWLRDPDGGDVPQSHIHTVTSSCFEATCRPGCDDVYAPFKPLVTSGLASDPEPIGRRLYIYMAGHGFGPAMREASLLTANAGASASFNVSGGKVADLFSERGYFEEVVLFMDCCRDPDLAATEGVLPFDRVSSGGTPARWFYGFAAGYRSRAREKPIDGMTRGLFTVAVLEALGAGASTSSELRTLVRERMIELMDEDDYQKPVFQGEDDLHFAAGGQLPTLKVTLGDADDKVLVTIERGGSQPVAARERLSAGESFERRLPPGLYDVRRSDNGGVLVRLTVESVDVEI